MADIAELEIYILLPILVGICLITFFLGWFLHSKSNKSKIANAETISKKILEDAETKSQETLRDSKKRSKLFQEDAEKAAEIKRLKEALEALEKS